MSGTADGQGAADSAPSPLRRYLATGCGIGLLPFAPGTWASAATALIFALLFGVRGLSPPLLAVQPGRNPDWFAYEDPVFTNPSEGEAAWMLRGAVLVALALIFAGGVWLGNRAVRDFGVEDPGAFVLDEVVGQGLALLPLLPGPISAWGVVAAFVLFRLFDIWKPPPCARLERLHGGLGIMADDVMAGLYAALIVALLPV